MLGVTHLKNFCLQRLCNKCKYYANGICCINVDEDGITQEGLRVTESTLLREMGVG